MTHYIPDDYSIDRAERSGALLVFAGVAAFWTLLGFAVWMLA